MSNDEEPLRDISTPSEPADEADTNMLSLFITTFVIALICFGGYFFYHSYFSKRFNAPAALNSLDNTLQKTNGQPVQVPQ